MNFVDQYTMRLRDAAEARGYEKEIGLAYTLGCCQSILSGLASMSPKNKAYIEEKVQYIERMTPKQD